VRWLEKTEYKNSGNMPLKDSPISPKSKMDFGKMREVF
jgi:hypothetical protein